jgi:hypothetical protein
MDDFLIPTLNDSRNEWCERLTYILIPHINEGIKSIFNEALKMCIENNEPVKYLMTFQNLLSKIPQWNSVIIQEEVQRIITKSGCNYINELITCVHIIQLKVLTCIRVGNKQKKIDISIPKLDHFIHSVYIQVARKIYANVYLFERGAGISPLQTQKNNREIETIIRECIMITIRESIPTEQIVRAYLDESVEHEEEVIIENIEDPAINDNTVVKGGLLDGLKKTGTNTGTDAEPNANADADADSLHEPPPPEIVPIIKNVDDKEEPTTTLKFNDIDYVIDEKGVKSEENAPKDLERLEEISMSNSIKRKLEEEDDDNSGDKIKIHDDSVDLGSIDVFNINGMGGGNMDSVPLLDVEEL